MLSLLLLLQELPHVEVAPPLRKTVFRKLDLTGEAAPDQVVTIYGRVQGYLDSLGVDVGAWVKSGAPMASIAVPELVKQLQREQAELAACAPAIDRDRATLAWRETVFRRLDDLRARTADLVNAEMLDEAKGRFEVARAETALAVARQEVLRAAAAHSQAMIDFASIQAPFEGVVTARWVDKGQLIQPGLTKMFELMDLDPIRVRVAVSEVDVPFVAVRSGARVAIEAASVGAEVSRISWSLSKSTKTMWAEIDVPNADRKIRPGMLARVRLNLEAHENALVLPAAALVTEKRKSFVYVVKDGKARKTPITVGVDDGIEFEVKEGLREGDEVVVGGKNMISDGVDVRTTRKGAK